MDLRKNIWMSGYISVEYVYMDCMRDVYVF